jgi:hypothetical protein
VRLHASCMAVRPFARWFRRGWGDAYNHGAVTCFACRGFGFFCFRSARMTCGTQPPRRRVGTLELVGGDFARVAWGCEWGESPLNRDRSPGQWTCLHTPLMHCALPPSGPPDGEHPCCLRLAVAGGARPYGAVIARLQGFSSCSSAPVPHQWSSVGMVTILVVGRSKPGCGLCPTLSFKDVYHPGWGGGRTELGPASAWAGDPLLPLAFGGEGHPPALLRRRPPTMRGKANYCC